MIRTSNVEYVDLWRAGRLDVDFAVSSELETAYAGRGLVGVPAARQTDVFADGQVQIVEFEVEEGADAGFSGDRCVRRGCRRTPASSRSSGAAS